MLCGLSCNAYSRLTPCCYRQQQSLALDLQGWRPKSDTQCCSVSLASSSPTLFSLPLIRILLIVASTGTKDLTMIYSRIFQHFLPKVPVNILCNFPKSTLLYFLAVTSTFCLCSVAFYDFFELRIHFHCDDACRTTKSRVVPERDMKA
jgi:hypothetical protein